MVPPTLVEVGQPVLEGQFHQLEQETQEQTDFHVTDYYHFAHPANQVRKHVDVVHLFLNLINNLNIGNFSYIKYLEYWQYWQYWNIGIFGTLGLFKLF